LKAVTTRRMAKVSAAIQAALMNTFRVPPEDFYQLIFELPKSRFLHTPSFVGMHYSDDLIALDLTFIKEAAEGNAACSFKRHQHARCRGCRRIAGRHDDQPLRDSRREHFFWAR